MKNDFILVLILVIMIPISCYGANYVNTRGYHGGYEYVDLGLPSGTKWATMNVGAESPEDNGDYFAWGETKPKAEYNWSTYKWCNGSYKTLTKYCTRFPSYGTVDNKTILELSDDAANANWGGDWRMPTKSELDELRTECTWTWTKQKGVNGYKVTSKTNGNSIFLPAAGFRNVSDLNGAGYYGFYWSGLLRASGSNGAYYLGLDSGTVDCGYDERYYGISVRPVLSVGLTWGVVAFDNNGGEGTMSSITINYPGYFSVTDNNFTRPGYEFIGWNTKADGTGTSYTVGSNITITSNQTLYAQWRITNGYEYVDLGLPSGTLWATMNIGAKSPEDYGDYFAWGETEPKENYDWSTYKWCNGSRSTITKYCTSFSDGTVDNKTTLELSDDAANTNWGGDWRMPTMSELNELRDSDYTTWTWTTQNGVNGYKVTSIKNGNSIFLPAAGYRDGFELYNELYNAGSYGGYLSKSLFENTFADGLWFISNYKDFTNFHRCRGLSVRPVLSE